MKIDEPLGVPGAPFDTLQAVQEVFTSAKVAGGQLIMITDQHGRRDQAQYAALIRVPGHAAELTAPAFGPQFGESGVLALRDLALWADTHGLVIKETVLSPGDFTRLVGEPDEAEVMRLIAAANPSDVGIYTTLPKKQDD
ncbi:DUF3197 domain-containing protein [Deinococcus cavernae]|uniref:DUF3197 domain-containing protein n=1 Tax=Deinococcus cavernae TaxID=2320857 RepID=A0A418V4P9_9DEIO|nr:DUF3197 domain-containing protein [Deinococcus cavernae]RJF71091.1 DUF3197 domain-containing protein [Deinococcus cavernae]